MAPEQSAKDSGRVPGVPEQVLDQQVSRFGFGTSALLSRVSRRDSVRLLQVALEEGITHFDTARSYGFGEAEMAVGEVLAGQRDRVTVTTKVGIVPPRRTTGLLAAKAMARGLLRVAPGIRSQLRRRAGVLVQAERFDAASMTASLHTSLRQLRTDYVDFLLLHEPSCAVLAAGEPLSFLEHAQREGKVRSFGIAVTPEVATFALERAAAYTGVLQIPDGVFAPKLDLLPRRPAGVIFTHSALGTQFVLLRAQLERDAGMAMQWSEALGVDVVAPGELLRLALQYALSAERGVCVLFTSTKPEHIRQNAAVLNKAAPAQQRQRFAAMVQSWSALD